MVSKNLLFVWGWGRKIRPSESRLSSLCKPHDVKWWSSWRSIYPSKKEGKYQESVQSSTTPDPGHKWESDNFEIRHKRETRGQPFPSRWPQGTNKQTHTKAWQKQDRNNINDPQKKHCLETVSKNILLEGLNRFHGTSTSPLVQMWIKTHRCLVGLKDP